MDMNELKKVWKREQKKPKWDYSRSELLMLINNKMISFEKDVKSRDRLEIIACLLVGISFSVMFFLTNSMWQQIGSAIIVGSAGFIWYKLRSSRKRTAEKESGPDKPLSDYLKAELTFVSFQKQLLDNIMWWYILPITTGILFFAVGFHLHWIYKLSYMVLVVVIGGIIWKINQNAVAERFDPLISEIQNSLHFLEEKE